MRTIALSILVMGVSIAAVILIWSWFGWIGPSFSATRLLDQQQELRAQYGLPYQAPTPKNLLEVPPSERAFVTGNQTEIANATTPVKTNDTSNSTS